MSLAGHVKQMAQVIAFCQSDKYISVEVESSNIGHTGTPNVGVLDHTWGGQILLEWLFLLQEEPSVSQQATLDPPKN